MTKTAREEMWRSRVEQFKQSGQKLSEWCSANEIRLDTFSYWFTKVNTYGVKPRNEDTVEWISLKISEDVSELSSESRLTIKIGQIAIDINRGFDPSLLLDVVKVLNKAC